MVPNFQTNQELWGGPIGHVDFEERPGHGRLCTWRPGFWAGASLPTDFRLELVELAEPGGPRRYAPASGMEAFLLGTEGGRPGSFFAV